MAMYGKCTVSVCGSVCLGFGMRVCICAFMYVYRLHCALEDLSVTLGHKAA